MFKKINQLKMIKYGFITLALLATPVLAHAAGENSIGVDASVENGGLAIGADYERAIQTNLGVGGYLHYFPKSTTVTNPANGYFAFGADAAGHYKSGHLDFFMGPGLGFISIDSIRSNVSNTLSFGPRIAFGVTYQLNDNIAVGFEENSYWIWFDSDFNGNIMNDLAARFRATF